MRSPLRLASIALALAAPMLTAAAAHAGPSAWASVSGGAIGWRQKTPSGGGTAEPGATPATPDFRADGVLVLEAGVGTPARLPVIVGGLFRITPLLADSAGADMAWLARVCNRGYQVGGFGLAADVGVYARTWGTPSQGFAGSLSLGAPFGLTLSFHTMVGSDELLAFGGSIGVDLLRLTLFRETLLNWWPNPEVKTRRLPASASAPSGPRAAGLGFVF